MNTAILISRHRQWRAWQFARRHSRGFSDDDTWGGPCDPDDWKKNALIGAVVGLALGSLLFISPELFGRVMGFILFIGIIGWLVRLFL